MLEIATDIPVPARIPPLNGSRRVKELRVTAEIREAFSAPSPTVSVLVDKKTKWALCSMGGYRGWKMVTQKEGENYRVWRVA